MMHLVEVEWVELEAAEEEREGQEGGEGEGAKHGLCFVLRLLVKGRGGRMGV